MATDSKDIIRFSNPTSVRILPEATSDTLPENIVPSNNVDITVHPVTTATRSRPENGTFYQSQAFKDAEDSYDFTTNVRLQLANFYLQAAVKRNDLIRKGFIGAIKYWEEAKRSLDGLISAKNLENSSPELDILIGNPLFVDSAVASMLTSTLDSYNSKAIGVSWTPPVSTDDITAESERLAPLAADFPAVPGQVIIPIYPDIVLTVTKVGGKAQLDWTGGNPDAEYIVQKATEAQFLTPESTTVSGLTWTDSVDDSGVIFYRVGQ